MSLVTLERFMWRLKTDRELASRFVASRADALGPAELDAQERAALERGDLAALWRLGVHPLLLAPFGRLCGIAPEAYRSALQPVAGVREIRS